VSSAIEHGLRADTRVDAIESVAQWWPQWLATASAGASPIARAIVGGFAADRVGWAFATGYQAALRALVPDLPDDVLAAFCVTEASGKRPRDIRTTITQRVDGGVAISGAKLWTTLGPASSLLLVVGRMVDAAATGDGGERPRLRVARVPSGAPGLSVVAMPATRFVPEVPHACVQLDDVRLPADALLPGDGYETCVKPFRTLEDTYVTAAVLAYLLREARARDWPAGLRDRLAATLATLVAVAAGPPDSPASQVVLEGALCWAHQLYYEAGALWAAAADDAAARWQRDFALFAVAGDARAQRAARARERLAQQGGTDD
jgi:acyl-CoA dehydrogenase